ncbi:MULTISPECIES: AI-2E family transporter [Aerosakkonema]|uniref:AI-2E family transporter n=1 Tax=Aerosakkonema TaxID=1246629 RepID=UPI0035BB450E
MTKLKPGNGVWEQLTNGAPLAVILAAVLYILYRLLPVLELFAVAALVGLVLRTTLQLFQKLVKIRWLAVVMLVSIVVSLGLFLALIVIPNLFTEAQVLSLALPNYLNSLIKLSQRIHQNVSLVPDLSQGLAQLRNIIDRLVGLASLLLTNTLDLSINTIATLILAIYMTYDPDNLIKGILRLVPRRHHQRARRLIEAINIRLQGWIFGTVLAMLIIGIGATIGLLVLRVPLPVSFGFLAGVLEIIPYVGAILGAILPALVALTISPTKAILVLGLFFIINQLDAHIVQPIVMAQRVKLHPVMVILSFLCLGELLGFTGVLLAVPAAAVLVTIFDEFNPPVVSEEQSIADHPKSTNLNE